MLAPGRLQPVALLSLALSSVSGAQTDGPMWAASMVRPDTDLYVAVVGAADMRTGELGGALGALVHGVAGFEPTLQAWGRLAERLGLSPGDAFDGLLGRRAAFVAKFDAPPTGESIGTIGSWLLISELPARSADLLRKRLDPMPRAFIRGTPVLSLEGGAFEAGLVKGAADDTFTLLLAPSDRSAMFDLAVRDLDDASPPRLAVDGAFAELRHIGAQAESAVFLRTPAMDAKRGPGGWIGVAALREGPSLRVRAAIKSPFELDRARMREELTVADSHGAWSAESFGRLSRRALFVSLESNRLLTQAAWSAPLIEVASQIGIGSGFPGLALLTGRLAAAVFASDDGVLDLAVALEASDIDALAPAGDGALASILAPAFASAGASGTPPSELDFAGAVPPAMRTIDITRALGDTIGTTWKHGAKLSWRYAPSIGAESAQGATQRPGWWTLGVGTPAVEALSSELTAPRGHEAPLPWVTMVSVKPAEAVRLLEVHAVPLPRPVEVFRWIREANWFTLLGPDGRVVGGGRIELEKPATR